MGIAAYIFLYIYDLVPRSSSRQIALERLRSRVQSKLSWTIGLDRFVVLRERVPLDFSLSKIKDKNEHFHKN